MNDFPRNPSDPTDGTDDLDARIRSMLGAARQAAPAAPQLDLDDSVVPLRRRETPRRSPSRGWIMGGLAAVGTAAAVVAAVVVVNDDSSERLQPAPPATEPATTLPGTTVASVPDSSAPDTTVDSTSSPTTTIPGGDGPTWVAYVAGPDGVIGLDGDEQYDASSDQFVQITEEPLAAAFPGPGGTLYVQRHIGPVPDGTDAWSPEQTAVELFDPSRGTLTPVDLPHEDGTWLRLHDVGTLAGAEVILYEEMQTPDPTGPDAGRLLLFDVASGEVTVVDDDFGGWERGSNLFQVADNGLVVGETIDLVVRYPTIHRVLETAPEITVSDLGLQDSYTECGAECPRLLTVDPTGTVFAYTLRNSIVWTDLVPEHVSDLGNGGVDLASASQVMVTADAAGAVTESQVVVVTTGGGGTVLTGTSVSLGSDTPAPTVTNDLDPTDVDGTLVIGQNVATGDDLRRLPQDRNGTGLEMSCPSPTLKTWEYDVGFAPTERGVTPGVQLGHAITETNAEFSLTGTADELPTSGWTMIVDGSHRWFTLPARDGNWAAVVSVAGKPWSDSWRYYDAWFCRTDEVVPATEPTGPAPVFAPLEDGMPAITEALGGMLTYGSAEDAVDELLAALTRPDGCDVAPTATASQLTTGPEEAGYSVLWRHGCDDSSGGAEIEVTVTQDRGGMWTIAAASLATLCLRGVTDNGLCV